MQREILGPGLSAADSPQIIAAIGKCSAKLRSRQGYRRRKTAHVRLLWFESRIKGSPEPALRRHHRHAATSFQSAAAHPVPQRQNTTAALLDSRLISYKLMIDFEQGARHCVCSYLRSAASRLFLARPDDGVFEAYDRDANVVPRTHATGCPGFKIFITKDCALATPDRRASSKP